MSKQHHSENVDKSRRSFMGTAAATAAATSFLPTHLLAATNEIRPFRVHVPERDLLDLRRRLQMTRFAERETVSDQSQGVQLATIQALTRYWASGYDWHRFEAK